MIEGEVERIKDKGRERARVRKNGWEKERYQRIKKRLDKGRLWKNRKVKEERKNKTDRDLNWICWY